MSLLSFFFFFFNDTATTEIYTTVHTLSLHDALPISPVSSPWPPPWHCPHEPVRSEEHTSELQSRTVSSYAVFCLKKKKNTNNCTKTNPLTNQMQEPMRTTKK